MKRKLLAAFLVASVLGAAPGYSETMQESLVAQLTEQGFTHISISRTWLGRVRIEATSPEYKREIIFNPRTDEILRDYWDELGTDAPDPSATLLPDPRQASRSGSGTSGSSDDNSGKDGSKGSSSGKDDGGGKSAGDNSGSDDHGDDGKDDSKDDSKDDGKRDREDH